MSFPRRDEAWLASLDPAQGSKIQKTRPALVISPDEANEYVRTIIVAPMTTAERPYPTRAAPSKTAQAVLAVLVEMFTRA